MKRESQALATVGILIAAALGQPVATAGSFPGANGKIAFAGKGHIEVINADGTGRATLAAASPASSVSEAAWNASGTKLVFRDGDTTFKTMNADGSNLKALVTADDFAGNPTWSSDGSVVAFDKSINLQGTPRIYTVPAAGGTATELAAVTAGDPSYSPDGTKIAFEFNTDTSDIGVMNADGSNAVSVTTGASGNNGDFDPSWSPDGKRIAFTRAGQIWTMDADGSDATQLTTGADASYPTWSPDGTKIAFERDDNIWVMDRDGSDATSITNTPDEDEGAPDWGVATPGVTSLVSVAPGGVGIDAHFAGASADGSRVFFETTQKLTLDDTGANDVYEYSDGVITLVSKSSGSEHFNAFYGRASQCTPCLPCPVGASHPGCAAASEDGRTVFFWTKEKATHDDDDNRSDVYKYSAGSGGVRRVSQGDDFHSGNGPETAWFAGASADGHPFFHTKEKLKTGDSDGDFMDVYHPTNFVSRCNFQGPSCGNGPHPAYFAGVAEDGRPVFFETTEKLVRGGRLGSKVKGDRDSRYDVYAWTQEGIELVSIGPAGGNGDFSASYVGASADGARVFFETRESLVREDSDARNDVYQWTESTKLVSTGLASGNGDLDATFVGASADGTSVFFETTEQLVAEDTDVATDVYERSGGRTTLISTTSVGGNGDLDATFAGASADGTSVFFETTESLVAEDTDARTDVYARSGGVTALVSTGPTGGNGDLDATFAGASTDGSRVFFETAEKLTAEDTDSVSAVDIYERRLP